MGTIINNGNRITNGGSGTINNYSTIQNNGVSYINNGVTNNYGTITCPVTGNPVYEATDYGLIFDASANPATGGKLWLDFNGNSAIDAGTDIEYAVSACVIYDWTTGSPGTLTLNNFAWTTPAEVALTIIGGDVNLDITGSNTITSMHSGPATTNLRGMMSSGKITVGGSGTLHVTGGNATSTHSSCG